jgi:hypothetical protein
MPRDELQHARTGRPQIQIWELPTPLRCVRDLWRELSTLVPQSASERVNACVQRYQLVTLKVMENTHTHSLSPVPFRLVSKALSPKLKFYLTACTLSTCVSKPYIPLNLELDKSPRQVAMAPTVFQSGLIIFSLRPCLQFRKFGGGGGFARKAQQPGAVPVRPCQPHVISKSARLLNLRAVS